jgi:hypothetical protein
MFLCLVAVVGVIKLTMWDGWPYGKDPLDSPNRPIALALPALLVLGIVLTAVSFVI